MTNTEPRMSIGMPVCNGEKYLAEALDSILAQTHSDFELIISDNASADDTARICDAYATRDHRIRYVRNETNLGASRNFNRVFELSSGEYFKWAAYDDVCAPEYLQRCIEVLDQDPSIAVCHPMTVYIDGQGNTYDKDYDDCLDFRSPSPHERFRDYLLRPAIRWNAVFGVIRSSELRKTHLIGPYPLSDQVLLGELVLRGKLYRVPEALFFRRDHPQTAMMAHRSDRAYAIWFDPANENKLVLPRKLKALFEYLRATRRVRLSAYEQLCCHWHLTRWGYEHLLRAPLKRHRNRAYALLTSADAQKKLMNRISRILTDISARHDDPHGSSRLPGR
ncbi:glycosyltransferase family 2 protein [Chloroflexota bacterium]